MELPPLQSTPKSTSRKLTRVHTLTATDHTKLLLTTMQILTLIGITTIAILLLTTTTRMDVNHLHTVLHNPPITEDNPVTTVNNPAITVDNPATATAIAATIDNPATAIAATEGNLAMAIAATEDNLAMAANRLRRHTSELTPLTPIPILTLTLWTITAIVMSENIRRPDTIAIAQSHQKRTTLLA